MKKRIKALPKSQREAKRYYLFDPNSNMKQIKDCYLYLFGALKFAESGFVIKSEKDKIIKINLDFVNDLNFTIYYCNRNNAMKVKVLKVSGTLESLEQ